MSVLVLAEHDDNELVPATLHAVTAAAALDSDVTMMTATDMTSAVSSRVVTASAEQIPRICSAIGLSRNTGLNRRSLGLSAI